MSNVALSRDGRYRRLREEVFDLIDHARRSAARSVNSIMTATYWEIGRRIVVLEQSGRPRAGYGEELLERLSRDLSGRLGRGFSRQNLQNMRSLYVRFPVDWIRQTLSGKSVAQELEQHRSASGNDLHLADVVRALPLPWSHYLLLLGRARSPAALDFYHREALRGGWTVRQLARQIDSQFYERAALSRNKAALLRQGQRACPEDVVSTAEELQDPLVLEFLGLKDEYSENDLEQALIHHLERFLLELGNDFSFVGRQRRLRIDDEWYRVDLLFFHRRLRCLVIIDLKLGRFTHADAGQMHLYLNYAREHWTQPGENPPVGIILCAAKGAALVHYATDNLPNKLLVREYLTLLPDERLIAAEIDRTRARLEHQRPGELLRGVP